MSSEWTNSEVARAQDDHVTAGPPGSSYDDRPCHVIEERILGSKHMAHRRCRTPGCRVDTDGSADCGGRACKFCGMAGLGFSESEGPGGVWTVACDECDKYWRE